MELGGDAPKLFMLPVEIVSLILTCCNPKTIALLLAASRKADPFLRPTDEKSTVWPNLLEAHFGPDWQQQLHCLPNIAASTHLRRVYFALAEFSSFDFRLETPDDPPLNYPKFFDGKPQWAYNGTIKVAVCGERRPGKVRQKFSFRISSCLSVCVPFRRH